jgi:DNA-binding transcriptional regulator GbsR (MarR family)
MSLDEIAILCKISKSIASKRLQILETMKVVKKIKVEKKIRFCKTNLI